MSKIKKVLAVFLTLAMVLGMGLTTFAENVAPSENDSKEAVVSNVEENATVTAYQIVKANYNDKGFYGYSAVKEGTIADPLNPTSEELTVLAKNTDGLKSVNMNPDGAFYKASLNPGYWMVLVKGSTKVYNPMLLGIYYTESGSDNTMTADPVDANTNWDLAGTDAYAKSSEVPITKTADKETANLGESVHYTIKTVVPDYSAEYTNVKFDVKDTLTGLTGLTNINVIANDITTENYTLTSDDTSFTVSFKSDWILSHGGTDITITYDATVSGDAVNEEAHSNKAEVNYTNNPGEDKGHNEDIVKIYTFDIDGDVTQNILKKVKQGETGSELTALEGAEFTLYTDEDCKNQYYNTKHTETYANGATAISDKDGKIYISGLRAGTYYLKETKAPGSYSLNNTVYKIVIDAKITNQNLESWSIKITDMSAHTDVTNNFSVVGGVASVVDGSLTEIMNTKISDLPSTGGIGTTIFTIGGCLIMIIAAALFFASRRKNNK